MNTPLVGVAGHPHVSAAWRASLRAMRLVMRADAGTRRLTGALTAAQYLQDWRSFVRAEMTLPRGTVREYALRGSPVHVALRHRSGDVGTFTEIFHRRIYAPPASVVGALDGTDRILDLGANVGLFGAWARLHWPEASLVAVEPDAFNIEVLRTCVAANRGARHWEVREAAAANRAGSTGFAHGGGWGSRLNSGSPSRVPAIDVLPLLREVDFAKIDIEGGEWSILLDDRFAETSARVVALEYHPHLCPELDARSAACAALERAGFHVEPVSHSPQGHGTLWAWRS